MKTLCLIQMLLSSTSFCMAQTISVANEKENVVTVGLDNPLTIAVAGISSSSIEVTTDNGTIVGVKGYYTLHPTRRGKVTLTIYRRLQGKLKEIGKSYFRANRLWDPVFKIGATRDSMSSTELAAQDYVRAELENSDYDMLFPIESFKVCITHSDTCLQTTLFNVGYEINEAIKQQFLHLHSGDIVLFKDIDCSGPDGEQRRVSPVLIFVK